MLWEQTGSPQRLTAAAIDADWVSDSAAGEALWVRPRSARTTSLALGTDTALAAAPVDAVPVDTGQVDTGPVDIAATATGIPAASPGIDNPDSTSFS